MRCCLCEPFKKTAGGEVSNVYFLWYSVIKVSHQSLWVWNRFECIYYKYMEAEWCIIRRAPYIYIEQVQYKCVAISVSHP